MSYKSYLSEINKELTKVKKARIKKASIYLTKMIKENISNKSQSSPGSSPGKLSGKLIKGIGYKVLNEDTAIVGAKKPAYHAHLLEFGTKQRRLKKPIFVKKISKKVVSTGRMLPRPFMYKTFAEESNNIKKIMQDSWI